MNYTQSEGKMKRIKKHSMSELNAAVADAEATFPQFYQMLYGIDAYMERRRRREKVAAVMRMVQNERLHARVEIRARELEDMEHMWGDND